MPLWRNSAVNLAGQALPALAYALVLPTLIHELGLQRFGVFALVWTLFSYLTLFDLGLGRGTARAVARAREVGEEQLLYSIVWTSWLLLLVVAGGAGLVVWAVAPVGGAWLRLPQEVQGEALQTFRLTGAVLPVFLVAWALQAVLEGLRWFGPVAAVRAALGITTAFGLALSARSGLPAMVWTVTVARAGYLLALGILVERALPGLWRRPCFHGRVARELVDFGRWVVVHAWMAPVLTYGDRFLVAILRGAADVSVYAVPQETVLRLMLVPAAVATAAYPVLSGSQAVGATEDVQRTYSEGLRLVSTVLGPGSVLLVLFPGEILRLWIGPQAQMAADPLRLLAVGGLLLGCAQVPSVAFAALGRPDVPARVTLALALPFVATAAMLVQFVGARGAALAWSLRAAVQFCAYAILLGRLLGPGEPLKQRNVYGPIVRWLVILAAAAAVDAAFCPPPAVRLGLVGVLGMVAVYRLAGSKTLFPRLGENGCVGSARFGS
ncbi:MAG: MATE family efflux transporter [Armatimonadetes bacterium]|nr:MATE family efflux transporter [Armatimonadota bacterium]MDW8153541.1 MATE family efflux transporter [Armatimonadota bacterium]